MKVQIKPISIQRIKRLENNCLKVNYNLVENGNVVDFAQSALVQLRTKFQRANDLPVSKEMKNFLVELFNAIGKEINEVAPVFAELSVGNQLGSDGNLTHFMYPADMIVEITSIDDFINQSNLQFEQ